MNLKKKQKEKKEICQKKRIKNKVINRQKISIYE